MLGQSWLNEALDIEAGHAGGTEAAGSIVSVVQGFLRNDAGFSRTDVARYVNTALQNEASELWNGRVENLVTAKIWRRHVKLATGGFEGIGTVEAARRLDALTREDSARYDLARSQLTEAVRMIQHSDMVALAPETREWVARLDQDEHFATSDNLPAFVDASSPLHSLVDFVREIEKAPGRPEDLRRGPNKPPAKVRETIRDQRGVSAGQGTDRVLNPRTVYHPIVVSDEIVHGFSEYEVA